MTEKLYDLDAYRRTFSAQVIACEEKDGLYLIELDRTCFFPEGGGQGADHGTLNGVCVTDVHEKNGIILHTAGAPLPVGESVQGEIDWERRLDMMQQHSGEHLFTGLVHKAKGYDNVGFHIGTDAVTIDFNGILTPEEAAFFEQQANAMIWKDVPIRCWYPDKETLEQLPYRSKKAIDGDLRIVEVTDCDICACCGTHVATTGGIGQIKIIDMIHYKGGVRVSILCGRRALVWENTMLAALRGAARLMSVKMPETEDAVARLQKERDEAKYQAGQLAMQLFEAQTKAEAAGAVRVADASLLPPAMLNKAAASLSEGAEAALVYVCGGQGARFALASSVKDMRAAAKALTARFGGKGGGKPELVQGMLAGGDPDAWRAALAEALQA